MMSKKTQQEIIVTVLLVLIALAAVAAVATFVINNVKKSTAGADDKLACIKVELNIAAVAVGSNVTVQRLGSAEVEGVTVKLMVGGVAAGDATAIGSGETKTLVPTIALAKGSVVEASAVLSSGYVCPAGASATVA